MLFLNSKCKLLPFYFTSRKEWVECSMGWRWRALTWNRIIKQGEIRR